MDFLFGGIFEAILGEILCRIIFTPFVWVIALPFVIILSISDKSGFRRAFMRRYGSITETWLTC
ncbi:MAG: hypothetical protein ABJA67_17610 [Chthonomonadales bacterium]